MAATRTGSPETRYVLTDAGVEALDQVELCNCVAQLVGVFVQCPHCGTIYGHSKDMMRPKASRFGRNGTR